jgi:hypothetical protein
MTPQSVVIYASLRFQSPRSVFVNNQWLSQLGTPFSAAYEHIAPAAFADQTIAFASRVRKAQWKHDQLKQQVRRLTFHENAFVLRKICIVKVEQLYADRTRARHTAYISRNRVESA